MCMLVPVPHVIQHFIDSLERERNEVEGRAVTKGERGSGREREREGEREKERENTNTSHHELLTLPHLQWSDEEEVPAGGRFPAQSSLHRREELYMEAIRLFDEGKSWECGIPLCKELAKLYETELFDYQKLAAILVSPSALCSLVHLLLLFQA